MRSSCQPLRGCLRRCSTRRQTNRFLGPATELYDRPRDVHNAASSTVLQSSPLVIAYKSGFLSSLASTQYRQPSVFSFQTRSLYLSCLIFKSCPLDLDYISFFFLVLPSAYFRLAPVFPRTILGRHKFLSKAMSFSYPKEYVSPLRLASLS
jgi:hypothetical protein